MHIYQSFFSHHFPPFVLPTCVTVLTVIQIRFGRENYGPQYGPVSVSQSIRRSVSVPGGRIQPNRAGSGDEEMINRGGNMVPGTRIVPPCGPMRALEIQKFINAAS